MISEGKKTMTADEYIEHQAMVKENVRKVTAVKKFLKTQKPDLVINRGVGDAISEFKQWSMDEFDNDYGFAFKYLYELAFPKGIYCEDRLIDIETRLDALESKPVEDSKKQIKTLSGNIIKK